MIILSGSTPPTEQIRDQVRGLIVSGRLAANDRLPSVRKLAKDLNVAPGTVAKAYKALESEGFLIARTGGGTRVSPNATTTPRPVLDATLHLADTAARSGTSLDDTVRILRVCDQLLVGQKSRDIRPVQRLVSCQKSTKNPATYPHPVCVGGGDQLIT